MLPNPAQTAVEVLPAIPRWRSIVSSSVPNAKMHRADIQAAGKTLLVLFVRETHKGVDAWIESGGSFGDLLAANREFQLPHGSAPTFGGDHRLLALAKLWAVKTAHELLTEAHKNLQTLGPA